MQNYFDLSAEQYRAILRTSLDGFWVVDPTGQLLDVNDAYCEMTGFCREEVLRMRVPDLSLAETPEQAEAHLARIMREGAGFFETRHRKKDGGYLHLEVSVSFVQEPEKRIVVFLRDITQRREGDENYREIFNATSDALIIHDETGRVLSVNDRACSMFGCSQERALELSIGDLSANEHPYTQAEAIAKVQEAQRMGMCVFEWRSRRMSGELFWTEVALRSCSIGGRPRVIAAVRDIDERKRAGQALRESEEKFEQIFNSSTSMIAFTEPEQGRIVEVNETWARACGISRQDAVGKSALELGLWPEPTMRAACLAELAAKGRMQDFEIVLRMQGVDRPVLASGGYVDVRGSRFILWELRDISRQKLAERAQEELQAQLLQAQKMESVGRLAGGVAHDFNNLLTVINGYSERLLEQLPADDALRRSVEEIRHAGERAASLTQQLLVFSRHQVAQPRVINFNSAVSDTERLLRRLIGEDIHLTLALDPELGAVKADPVQINQVLMNLAVNARDAMPRGGQLRLGTSNVTLDDAGAMSFGDGRPGDYVRLTVCDTGVGMDEETRRRLFEPFFTTKPKGTGTGLGLSTAYGIVKQAGGWIAVMSEPEQGTEFAIYLPRAAGREEPATAAEYGELPGGTETILVVEDQASVRRYACVLLGDLGYQILEAASGADALDVAAAHQGPIHLVLTDVIMPGMTGPELADHLGPQRPEAQILYMSGYADDVLDRHGVPDDGLAFIQKPFQAEDLARKLRDLLDHSPRLTVLVVDDEASVRRLLNETLADAGYLVVEARHGGAAMEVLAQTPIDVMITDLVMPEKEGLETIGEVRRRYPAVKIISMSGAFGGHYLKVASMLGADARIAKPIDADELLRTVRGLE